MAFAMFLVVLIFLVVWPFVWYYYFKAKYSVTPTPSSVIYVDPNHIIMEPIYDGGEMRLSFVVGPTTCIMNYRDAETFVRRMKANNLTIGTMNEVKSLG